VSQRFKTVLNRGEYMNIGPWFYDEEPLGYDNFLIIEAGVNSNKMMQRLICGRLKS